MLIRYGAIGYAIYFHCLELIAGDIAETNVTFELEHDSEIIADNLKIKGTATQSAIEIVQEIMTYAISLQLFDEKDNRIFCFKLLKRLDTSMTSSKQMRELITKAKESHDGVMTESCKTRLEETRLDNTTPDNTSHNDDVQFFNMKELNALAVKYLGWQPVMTPGRAEQLRQLTSVFKEDVERGFFAASSVGSGSINYVIKASQGESKKDVSQEKIAELNEMFGKGK